MKIAPLILALPLVGCGSIDVISKVSTGDGPATAVGTGKSVRETRTAEAAATVRASGALRVTIRRGAPGLVVSAQPEILKRLKTEFKGGTLMAWVDGSARASEPIEVQYTGPGVTGVEGSGATTFDVAELSGKAFSINLSGASALEAKGSSDILTVTLSGASTATTRFLVAKRLEVHLSGASTANVAVSQELAGEVNGASRVYYMKRPQVVKVRQSGASQVTVDK